MKPKKHKILLMIDEKKLKSRISDELAKLRCHLSEANEDAIKKVYDEVPHLIIIDENYRKGEGKALALSLKEDEILKYIPIILLVKEAQTVSSKDHEKIDHYIRKSSAGKSLVGTVREVLANNYNELDFNPLTHLPGIKSTVLCVDKATHSKRMFAVCCVDLSDLAPFNVAYGDARGDEVIIRLGKIIREAIKFHGSSEDFLGHLGGDDFFVVTDSEMAAPLTEVIIQNFDSAVGSYYDPADRDQGYIVHRVKEGAMSQHPIMTLSVAIIYNDYMPVTDMGEISHIADELKKYMKTLPGSCYVKYRRKLNEMLDPKDNSSLEVRFPSKMKSVAISGMGNETNKYNVFFNTVLKNKKIRTLYQPIVDLKTKKVVGYEALTRALSDYPVDEATLLFSVAREADKVKELDKLCVEYALKSSQDMATDKKLFLNINHETLIDPKFMKEIFAAKGKLSYKNLGIEVTEQSLLRSFDKIKNALLQLKKQGISVAIDDVGGGAVSLRDVAILKPDYIKFDRSLVRQIDISTTKQQIVMSMIVFAKGIHASTTAEGIETEEEYKAAMMCGINLGQGYYFSRPAPAFPDVPANPEAPKA